MSDALRDIDSDLKSTLKTFCNNNINEIIFAHLNINFIRIDLLSDVIKGHTDVRMMSEANLDNSFSDGQFLIGGYGTRFRLDRNKLGGGIMLSVRRDISAKLFSVDMYVEFFNESAFQDFQVP